MAVPLNTDETRHAQRALRELEFERKRESQERLTGWTVLWTLFAFKMATVGIIWWAASGSTEANAFITVTTWYWLTIPVIAISGFVAYRLRLRNVRKRVQSLRKAEFMEENERHSIHVLTDEEVQKLAALEDRRRDDDHPGEG